VLCLAGCDAGTPQNASTGVGPPLHVVGFNASGDAGSNGTTLPADGTVQIAFDRLLAPDSVTRQSFELSDGSGVYLEPVVTYDPVARVVSLQNPNPAGGNWLTVGATYYVQMSVAKASDTTGTSGPKAIDGATLTTAVTEVFQAVAPSGATPSLDRPIDFCDDILPVFIAHCSGGPCHSGPSGGFEPREGLILDAPTGLLNTAVNRVSQESNTGGLAGLPSAPEQFGVDMPIIAAGSPGDSWLMYKILLAPSPATTAVNPVSCGDAGLPAPVSQASAANPAAPSVPLSASEQAILGEMILGEPMPYPPSVPGATNALGVDEVQRIRAWIAQLNVPADQAAQIRECPNDCE
jgi:hypothetical protein